MDSKILLIDDSAILRRIAVNVLSAHAGCGEVVTATRATEGFARACGSGIGLVLVDYQIAGLPGADLCRRLLDEPRTSRVPVILLLGPGMKPPVKGSLPANIVDFLVKPFTPEQLVSAVKAAMAGTGGEVPVAKLNEPATPPGVDPFKQMRDHHEVAAVVNVTALVRRETNRLLHARTVSKQAAAPADLRATPRRGFLGELTRLRAAFNEAARRQETGAFRVKAGSGPTTEIYLENGHIVVVATTDAKRYSEGADGVVPPKVGPATLDEAVSEQSQTGVPFFLTLGAHGLLSKAAATGLLHRFGQRHFARCWAALPDALTCEFVGLDALPGFALRLESRRESVDEWLLGALRNLRSEDIIASARLEGYGGTPSLNEDAREMLSALPWNDEEREFCRQIGPRRDLATVAKSLGITTENAYLLLFRFRCMGMMEYRSTASAFVVTPRTNVRRVLPLHR